jgi:Phage integrase, N-terminal SAM-like domain
MGTAEPSSSGKSWRARWKGPEGTTPEYPSKSGFSSEAKARKYANDQEAAIRARRYIDPNLAETSVDEWWQRWFPVQDHLRPNSLVAYEQNYRLHIKPRWGSVSMGPVVPIEIQEYRTELRKTLGESTVTLIMSIMRGMFDDAFLNRLIQTSPFPSGHRRHQARKGKVTPGAKPQREPILITLDQLDRICERHDTWMQRWRRACDVGTEADPEPIAETLRLHDGKHFHGTMMDDQGAHTVMRDYRLGHATPGTRGVYSHPTIDMRVQLISKLQRAWEAHQVRRNGSSS